MKIKNILLTSGLIFVLASIEINANETEAKKIFEAKCMICHNTTIPKDINNVTAPTIMGVAKHIKMVFPKKDDAIRFIVDYAINPSKNKAICMPQKIDKFGLMPSQKGIITKEELKKVANYIYNTYPGTNFEGMHQGIGNMHMYKGKIPNQKGFAN